MKRVPSDDASFRSRPPAEPPAMGVIGGRESLSTHMRKPSQSMKCPHCKPGAQDRQPVPGPDARQYRAGRPPMAEDFEYISHSRLEFRDGTRRAFLGEVPEPVVYGVQGKLREYYGAKEGPPIASTLDHIVA